MDQNLPAQISPETPPDASPEAPRAFTLPPDTPAPPPAAPLARGARRRWRRVLASRRLWLLALVLIAVWLRLAGLNKSVWEDEAHSLALAAETPFHPALLFNLSYLAFKAGHALTSWGALAWVRLPFLAAGLLALWMGWIYGRLRRDWLLGFILALGLALWPNKAFLDTMARDYAIGIFTSLAALVAWEGYRLRPGFPRLALGLLATVYAVLSFELNVLWLCVPAIYLGWEWAREALRQAWAWRRARRAATSQAASHGPQFRFPWRVALRLAGQTALAACVVVYAADLKMGSGFTARALGKAGAALGGVPASRPAPQAPAGAPLAAAAQPSAPPATPREPGLPDFFRYLQKIQTQAFQGPEVYPPAVFGMTNPNQITLTHLLYSPLQGRLDHQESVYKWLLAGLLFGSLILLFESPPLALTAWWLILGTGFAVFATGHATEDRYFVNSGVILLLALATLAARALWLGRWLLLRRHPRRNAAVTLALALALGVWGLITTAPAARDAAHYAYQDWRGIYDEAARRYPGGVMFLGIGPQSLQLTDDVAAAHHDLWHPADFWHSPRRNIFIDAVKNRGYLDLFLLDQLNAREGLVLFKPTYWELDFKPFTQYPELFQFSEFFNMTCSAQLAGLGHRVFVTRGQAVLPLLPRLLDSAATGARQGRVYKMQCFFEVPGDYELAVGEAPGFTLTAAAADGTTLSMTTRPATPGTSATLARSAAWAPVAGHTPPIAMSPAHETAAYLTTPPRPFTTCTVTLVFDKPAGSQAPVVAWRRRPPARRFEVVTPSYDVGPVDTWPEGQSLLLGMPLRVKRTAANSTVSLCVQGYLFDMQRGVEVGRCETFIRPSRTTLAPGDLLWLGPIELNPGELKLVLNRDLMFSILPLYQDPAHGGELTREPILNTRLIEKKINQYVACYLRIVPANGRLRVRFAYPKE